MTWTAATLAEQEIVLDLIRAFYAEEGLRFDEIATPRAARELLSQPDRGTILLLEIDGEIAGYLVATLGFSLEFGGRFVLLDELFIRPDFRGRGAAKSGFQQVEAWAVSMAAAAIRLEVNHHNATAHAVYVKSSFIDDRRHLLTKWL
jgi:GNAT superfamily N-acetyltransferase